MPRRLGVIISSVLILWSFVLFTKHYSFRNTLPASLRPQNQPGTASLEVVPDLILQVGTAEDILAYTQTELSASPNQVVSLTFKNQSLPQFQYRDGWMLVQPGDENIVLAETRTLNPGESQTVIFRTPAQPGDYPYISPVPEHGKTMRGVLHIRER